MAYRSQSGFGAFIRPEYSVLGACDGANSTGPTGNPKATWMWMRLPGGAAKCYSPDDPAILQDSAPMMWKSAPDLPIAPKPTLPNPPAAGGGSTGASSSVIDSAMAWVKANPWIAAGIAGLGVFLVVKK